MKRVWYRQDRAAVLDALRQGQRPERATTMACGPLDELIALHDELGALPAVAGLHVPRQRAGLPDRLLLRTVVARPSAPSWLVTGKKRPGRAGPGSSWRKSAWTPRGPVPSTAAWFEPLTASGTGGRSPEGTRTPASRTGSLGRCAAVC